MIPGTILIVDDKEGEVKNLVNEFVQRGENAFYSGVPFGHKHCENVRLLIFDYWIDENSEPNSLAIISEIINTVFQKSKFFLIAIWSARIKTQDKAVYKEKIMKAYNDRYGSPIPCILLEPVGKEELGYAGLIDKISCEITAHPELNLLYEAEKIVDAAKIKVGAQIYEIGSWSALIMELGREYNTESIERLLLSIYLNMLERNAEASEEFKKCVREIKEHQTNPPPFNDLDFAKVYSAQYYDSVSEKEQIRSGDLLFNEKANKYYMVITPECDITNNKHTATTLIEATRIDHAKLSDTAYLTKLGQDFEIVEDDGVTISFVNVINSILHGKGGLKTNYGRLLFLKDATKFYHLIFDFHKVTSIKKARKISDLEEGYARFSRVETPLLNSFIQQYASHCSRFGTMSIPKEMSKAISSKLATKKATLEKKT
jgi:hypothetical protein